MICGYKQTEESHVLSSEKDRELRLRLNKKAEQQCMEAFKKKLPVQLRTQVQGMKGGEWIPVLPFATPGQLARETSQSVRVVDLFAEDALKKIRDIEEELRMNWITSQQADAQLRQIKIESNTHQRELEILLEEQEAVIRENMELRAQVRELFGHNQELISQVEEAEARNTTGFSTPSPGPSTDKRLYLSERKKAEIRNQIAMGQIVGDEADKLLEKIRVSEQLKYRREAMKTLQFVEPPPVVAQPPEPEPEPKPEPPV